MNRLSLSVSEGYLARAGEYEMFILLNTAQWPCFRRRTWKTARPQNTARSPVFPKLFQMISVLKIFFSPKLNALCLLFIDTHRVALEECVSLISTELFQTQVSSCSNLKREREGAGGKERAGMSREETWRIRCDSPPTCGTHTHVRHGCQASSQHPQSQPLPSSCPSRPLPASALCGLEGLSD